jgi:hypothetical protein
MVVVSTLAGVGPSPLTALPPQGVDIGPHRLGEEFQLPLLSIIDRAIWPADEVMAAHPSLP